MRRFGFFLVDWEILGCHLDELVTEPSLSSRGLTYSQAHIILNLRRMADFDRIFGRFARIRQRQYCPMRAV